MNDCGQSVDVKIIERSANPNGCYLRRLSLPKTRLADPQRNKLYLAA